MVAFISASSIKFTISFISISFEMLLEEKVQTLTDIRNALPFPLEDLEELADLEPGALGAPIQTRAEPVLKLGVRPASVGNVVRFEKKR